MSRILATCLALLFAPLTAADVSRVWLDTEHGPILIELDVANAPITTQNFLDYVDAGFYDGLIFHRVIEDFVVQAGGFEADFQFREPLFDNIVSEAQNGRLNAPGTIAMARGSDPDSANSQFYINTGSNANLDGSYTVFGEVVYGMGVVNRINELTTGRQIVDEFQHIDAPVRPPLIRRAVEVDGFPIMPLHTASWFDPARSGVGFNIEVTNDASDEQGPLMVLYWYDFSDGQPMWLTGVTGFEWGASSVTMDLIRVAGPNESADFLSPPPGDDFETWGQLTVSFDDCTTGRFSYDSPAFGSGEFVATRLTIPDGSTCQTP